MRGKDLMMFLTFSWWGDGVYVGVLKSGNFLNIRQWLSQRRGEVQLNKQFGFEYTDVDQISQSLIF